jgi:mRNA interferase YafQ
MSLLTLVWQSQFKKDFKVVTKRGKKLDKLAQIITELQHGKQLPAKNKNHKPKGNYSDCW